MLILHIDFDTGIEKFDNGGRIAHSCGIVNWLNRIVVHNMGLYTTVVYLVCFKLDFNDITGAGLAEPVNRRLAELAG